jgi:hypothetical protein
MLKFDLNNPCLKRLMQAAVLIAGACVAIYLGSYSADVLWESVMKTVL